MTVNLETLKIKLKSDVLNNNNAYDALLDTALVQFDSKTIQDDDDIGDGLSDSELQEIIEKLNEYALNNSDADQKLIYELTQALRNYMLTSTGNDTDGDTLNSEGDDNNVEKGAGDYAGRASMAYQLQNIKSGDDNKGLDRQDYKIWLNGYVGDQSYGKWFGSLTTDEQIAVLDHYDTSGNPEAISTAIESLSTVQQAHILAELALDGDDSGITFQEVYNNLTDYNSKQEVLDALLGESGIVYDYPTEPEKNKIIVGIIEAVNFNDTGKKEGTEDFEENSSEYTAPDTLSDRDILATIIASNEDMNGILKENIPDLSFDYSSSDYVTKLNVQIDDLNKILAFYEGRDKPTQNGGDAENGDIDTIIKQLDGLDSEAFKTELNALNNTQKAQILAKLAVDNSYEITFQDVYENINRDGSVTETMIELLKKDGVSDADGYGTSDRTKIYDAFVNAVVANDEKEAVWDAIKDEIGSPDREKRIEDRFDKVDGSDESNGTNSGSDESSSQGGDEETTLTGDLKDFVDAVESFEDTEDAENPITTFFNGNTNPATKEEIYKSLADGNSDLYKHYDGDVSEIMEYFWEYLADSGTTEQKEFLGMIDPYSPVHLSLMQKINNYKSNLDDDSDVDKDEEKYWEALEELSSAISSGDAGSLSSTTLGRLFPKDDDDEIEVGDVVDDIFGEVSEILDEGGTSSEVGDFISAVKKGESFSISDVEDIQEFSKGLFSNSSPILFLLKEEDGGDTVNKIFEELLSQLSSADHQTKVNFLRGINPESEFFDYLEDMGFEHILEIIEADEEDFNVDDYDEEEIDDFFENEFIKLTKIWYGSEVSSDYLNDLADATDSTEIKDILEKAEDEGVLESVLYAVASDNFEDGSAEFYNIFFKALRTTSDYADIFMNGIEPNSNLGRTFSKLIDNEIEPFTNLSYDVDKDTGNIDFGSSERKLLTILSNTNMEGTNIFFDTLETIQEEFEDAVGTDNRAIDKLIEYSQKKELSDDIFDDLLAGIETEDGEIDYSKAEDILDIIADNDSVLFKTLGEEQLGYLLEQFLSWITAQDGEDGLLEYFGGSLDEDSLLYKAFIKGGADADDFQDGDYNAFLNGVNNSDDAAIFIKQALKYNTEEGDITQFVTDRLQGTQGNDIDDAVEDIIEYAAADEQSMNDLIIEVASGGSNITSLDKKQLETLIKEIFDYIAKQKPAEDEDISEVALLFLDNITEGTPAYTIIQQEYPILADYLTIASTDKEYDDRDIASELKKLLVNKQLVNAYVQKATGTNETKASDNSDSTVSEDDGDYSLVEDDEDTDSNNVGNSFEEEEFSKATDAALAALSKTMNVAGEPDIDSGVLSDIFFEEYTVEDLSDAATDGNFTTQEVIGTLQLIPLDKQPDFIREYMADKSINPETRDYLLGRLMIMITNQEVGTRTSEAILENVGITNLTPQIIEKIMDNWAETMDKYTDASATAIDDTYEQVLAATGGLKPENNNNNFDSDVSPYGMPADSQEYGYGNPYGMMGGGMMGSPYGMMGMGGFSPYGMMGGMMGMGAMNMNPLGMYPSGMDMSYQAGYTAGMYQGIIQTGFNLGLSSGLPNMGTSPVGGTGMMQQPSSNVVLNISGNNNNISLGSSSQQSSTPQQASTRTADSVPTTAGTPSTKASIRDRRQND